MSKSQKQRKAERLTSEVGDRAKRISAELLAWIAGVSEQTALNFRAGKKVQVATAEKIADAVARIRRGLKLSDCPEDLPLWSGKWEIGESFPVSKIICGRRCGRCGQYHTERLDCNEA
jgi:hypothetical protein